MTVKIVVKFDRRLWGSQAIQRTAWNAAKMVRDLWLAQAPNLSGDYAKGLQRPQSILVKPGEIIIQNFSEHSAAYEFGVKAYNWGMQTLQKGKGVKIAKDGSRYKIIKVDPKGRSAFRKSSVASAIVSSFRATIPKGRTTFASYRSFRDIPKLNASPKLHKALKPKRALQSAMKGFFVISERAIRDDPKKWFHEAVPGHFAARAVQRQAEPIIARAIAQAAAAEAAAKARKRAR